MTIQMPEPPPAYHEAEASQSMTCDVCGERIHLGDRYRFARSYDGRPGFHLTRYHVECQDAVPDYYEGVR